MHLTIVSNIVKDKIVLENHQITYSLGGPPCYCGLIGKQFGAKVRLVTKFGKDFSKEDLQFFSNYGFEIDDSSVSQLPTTKFMLKIYDSNRELYLLDKCDNILVSDLEAIKTDCWIISPILDEVPYSVLKYLIGRKNNDFVMLDPQGYTRKVDNNNKILINESLDPSIFYNIDAVKLDPKELYCFSGRDDIHSLQKLKIKNNINYALFAENKRIHMLNKDKHYWLDIRKVATSDTTGAGDILASGISCA